MGGGGVGTRKGTIHLPAYSIPQIGHQFVGGGGGGGGAGTRPDQNQEEIGH